MQFQYISHAIPLLANKKNESFYEIARKIGYLSLLALLADNVLAIEAGDINNTSSLLFPPGFHQVAQSETDGARYINFATTPTSRTFDFDPGMLPEVAQVIFALRIKHANVGEPFAMNLSGNYLLIFTEDGIHILDMYTKNSEVYMYQSIDPNITIGLGVSRGLPRNYKSIIIKEDAKGKLYDYAALRSDNISTDRRMLSETLSHPFYQIAGQDGVEDKVEVTKAMTFYRNVSSHSRPVRCVKESMGVLKQIQEILGSGRAVCGPEAGSDILIANHQPVENLKLEENLVEAVDNRKYNGTVGFRLVKTYNFNPEKGQYALAYLTAAYHCNKSIRYMVDSHRKKRGDTDPCEQWTLRLVELFVLLGYIGTDVNWVVQSVSNGGLRGESSDTQAYQEFEGIIRQHPNEAVSVIEEALGFQSQATPAGPEEFSENAGAQGGAQGPVAGDQGGAQSPVAGAALGQYRLTKEQFKPLPNIGPHYRTKTIVAETSSNIHDAIAPYITALNHWIEQLKREKKSANDKEKKILNESIYTMTAMLSYLSNIDSHPNLVINTVTAGNVLIGMSIGFLSERTYYEMYSISPSSIPIGSGSFVGALRYLASDTLRYLFLKGLIDSAESVILTDGSARQHLKLGFKKHEEL